MISYDEITACIKSDFLNLDEKLQILFKENDNSLTPKLSSYLFSGSKRIRSALIFLLTRALGLEVIGCQLKVASATELIHNATLIHDDIIDDSSLRRGKVTINSEFNSKLAVIAGDFLLSLALSELQSSGSPKAINVFTDSLKEVCQGEIKQFFEKNKLISIDEYIEKSKNKTAMLFKAALVSAITDEVYSDAVEKFAVNFGIAFQIRDDLINVINIDNSKPFQDDIKNGIFNAPLIYLAQDNPNILHNSFDDIILELRKSDSIEKTKKLLGKYISAAVDSTDFLEDNKYKQAILGLCEYIGRVE